MLELFDQTTTGSMVVRERCRPRRPRKKCSYLEQQKPKKSNRRQWSQSKFLAAIKYRRQNSIDLWRPTEVALNQ
jgi:hypothetical protein